MEGRNKSPYDYCVKQAALTDFTTANILQAVTQLAFYEGKGFIEI